MLTINTVLNTTLVDFSFIKQPNDRHIEIIYDKCINHNYMIFMRDPYSNSKVLHILLILLTGVDS